MIMVDDFSRFTRVYFLQHKSGALSKFIQFKQDMEKEFGVPIKCLDTDNGRDYMSDQFQNYCREHGIQRQMTCPKTLQKMELLSVSWHILYLCACRSYMQRIFQGNCW